MVGENGWQWSLVHRREPRKKRIYREKERKKKWGKGERQEGKKKGGKGWVNYDEKSAFVECEFINLIYLRTDRVSSSTNQSRRYRFANRSSVTVRGLGSWIQIFGQIRCHHLWIRVIDRVLCSGSSDLQPTSTDSDTRSIHESICYPDLWTFVKISFEC